MPAPIDIASRSHAGPAKSNLTSQLRAADPNDMAVLVPESVGGRSGSISQGGIPMAQRLRRESMANGSLARSLIMAGGEGMSWGKVSMNSWLHEDIMMTGTSPFTYNSPSFHSSSYLPKLEADFCKDFSCCGLPLPTLHDLLRHYEEFHAAQAVLPKGASSPNGSRRPSHQAAQSNQRSPLGMHGIEAEIVRQHQMQQRQKMQEDDHEDQDDQQDSEVAGDMEMDEDDVTPPPNYSAPRTPQGHAGSQHASHPATPSNNQGYSAPPHTQSSQLQGIGYPTGHFSPDSSVPGTPLAPEYDYGFPHAQQNQGYGTDVNYGNYDFSSTELPNLCIDEPAKRLYSPAGQVRYNQDDMQMMMNSANGGALSGQFRDLQLGHGAALPMSILPEVDKPFKCPVIGCEKAYKNQNGLKYHKAHGHVNQTLHDNGNGTFSIVNPETSAPYPGTLGMEKEKPYRCEHCGKRYKNLNGLKYHRNHSTHGDVQQMSHGIAGSVVAVAGGIAGENAGGLL